MPISLSKVQRPEVIESIRRYFGENLDRELSEMQAGFLLDYFLSEIAPLAYNQGVEDAQKHFSRATEDLAGACFEEPMTFWRAQGKGNPVRRKPN